MSADSGITFFSVLKGLMRPLVRTLIRRGITAPVFYKMLKTVYVDVAHHDFRIDGTAPTGSRVSLLTGVHRRDVSAILADADNSWADAHRQSTTYATALSRWMTLPEYQGPDGAPRPLPRSSDTGLSFDGLVRAVNKDIRPRTVLDEMRNQGLVQDNEEGMLVLSPEATLGNTPDEHKLVYFAANLGDHIAAATENLASDPPPFFERALFYNRMTKDVVDAVETRARILAQSMLEDLNAQSIPLQQDAIDAEATLERFRLGVYFYREPADVSVDATKDRGGEEQD